MKTKNYRYFSVQYIPTVYWLPPTPNNCTVCGLVLTADLCCMLHLPSTSMFPVSLLSQLSNQGNIPKKKSDSKKMKVLLNVIPVFLCLFEFTQRLCKCILFCFLHLYVSMCIISSQVTIQPERHSFKTVASLT